jgi:hypothetical protein
MGSSVLTNAHLFCKAAAGLANIFSDLGKATGINALLTVFSPLPTSGSFLYSQYLRNAPVVAASKTSFMVTFALFFKAFKKSSFAVGKNNVFRAPVIFREDLFGLVNTVSESNLETAKPRTLKKQWIISIIKPIDDLVVDGRPSFFELTGSSIGILLPSASVKTLLIAALNSRGAYKYKVKTLVETIFIGA